MMALPACAGILAFLITVTAGKFLVPWLKQHGFVQPLKEEVVVQLYDENQQKSSGNSQQS